MNGTYGAGCTSRAGAWSVEIAPGATLDNAVLSVVLNDTACVLTLTELRTTGGAIVSAPSFAMTASYQGTASAFGSPVDFYANARLSSVSFAAAFVITVLYSDDPRLATASNTASFSAVQATASGQSVDAPDYTLDMAGINGQHRREQHRPVCCRNR